MSAEHDPANEPSAPSPQPGENSSETLTDFMDRMDREAFRRSLEQRDLRLLAAAIRPER